MDYYRRLPCTACTLYQCGQFGVEYDYYYIGFVNYSSSRLPLGEELRWWHPPAADVT